MVNYLLFYFKMFFYYKDFFIINFGDEFVFFVFYVDECFVKIGKVVNVFFVFYNVFEWSIYIFKVIDKIYFKM